VTDEDFLHAIIADPDTDSLRLVYADWLEETGENTRADLIRVQVELGSLAPDAPRRAELQSRERPLLSREQRRWFVLLTEWGCGLPVFSHYHVGFRRGLLEEVTLGTNFFVAVAAPLFATAPVRAVRLRTVAPFLEELTRCPELARVKSLELYYSTVDDAGLHLLANAPLLSGLQHLGLGCADLTSNGFEALVASPYLRLKSLDLSSNVGVGDVGIELLATAQNMSGLRYLDLRNTQFHERGARALVSSEYLRDLTRLTLSSTYMRTYVGHLLQIHFGDRVHFLKERWS
jgi:uncharacterized protein (TIGR02996 family)